MERWIPYEKRSKKKQREWNAKKRGSWHGVNPISRKTKNLKAYNRKKTRQRIDDPFDVSFCFGFWEKRWKCVRRSIRRLSYKIQYTVDRDKILFRL